MNASKPQDPTPEIDPVTLRRQRDCKRHPAGNIQTCGAPMQCAFCGMTQAAQEQYASEQAAFASWQSASNVVKGYHNP